MKMEPPITQISQIKITEIDPEMFELIGAAMEVHRELGGGMLEAVYQNVFEEELKLRGIPYFKEQNYSTNDW